MISVCIATHNGARFIKQQLKSVLCQLGVEDEIIISDDGSSDNTLEIISNINDKRIKIFNLNNQKNYPKRFAAFHYATDNFENALKYAKGDIIFLCDQDDIWRNDKIKVCTDELKTCDFVKHNYSIIDSNGYLKKEKVYNIEDYRHLSIFSSVLRLPFRGCCMAFKREIIDFATPFPKNSLQHDSWIGLNAVLKGFKFKYIDEPLIYHRIHETNVSELEKSNSMFIKISYRIKLIFQLISYQWRLTSRKNSL